MAPAVFIEFEIPQVDIDRIADALELLKTGARVRAAHEYFTTTDEHLPCRMFRDAAGALEDIEVLACRIAAEGGSFGPRRFKARITV